MNGWEEKRRWNLHKDGIFSLLGNLLSTHEKSQLLFKKYLPSWNTREIIYTVIKMKSPKLLLRISTDKSNILLFTDRSADTFLPASTVHVMPIIGSVYFGVFGISFLYHTIIESLALEKTTKIIPSNHQPITSICIMSLKRKISVCSQCSIFWREEDAWSPADVSFISWRN